MSVDEDRLGTITRNGERFDLSYERRIAKPIETVWAAITTPERIADWFAFVELDPRVGGRYHIRFSPDDAPIEGKITAFDPPRLLEHSWPDPGHPDSLIRYELEPDGDGCILRFSQTSLPAIYIDALGGWHFFLDAIEGAIEGRHHGWTKEAEDQIMELYKDRLAAVGIVR